MSTSNGIYAQTFILTAGSSASVVSNDPLPAANAIDIAPSQFQVNALVGAIPQPLPTGGTYAALLSKASATNYDVQFADYWNDIAVPLAAGQVNLTDEPPPMTNFKGAIQLPAFSGTIAGTQSLQLNLQLPHSWLAGSDIFPHLHYSRGPTGTANTYGQLAVLVPSQTSLSGTYLWYVAAAYISIAVQTVLGATGGGNSYAAYYESSKNVTMIWSETDVRYVLATGDWRTAGPHGTLTARQMNGNTGTLIGANLYVPSIGTFNGAQLGPYTALGGGGTPYAYAKFALSSITYPTLNGTYTYVSDNISVALSGGSYIATEEVAATFHAAYYCESTGDTIAYSTTDAAYVILDGNVAAANSRGPLLHVLTGNTGTPNPGRPGYSMPTTGTFNSITLSTYQAATLARFLFEWAWTSIGDPFPDTITHVVTQEPSAIAYTHMLITLGKLTGTGKKLSSILIARLTRTPFNHADSYEDPLWALSFDIHAQMHGIGYGPNQFSGA